LQALEDRCLPRGLRNRRAGQEGRTPRRSSWISAAVAAAFLTSAVGLLPGGQVASGNPQSLCLEHHAQEFVWYTSSCTGHDEPEIDPLSNKAGSAQDLTWTVVLPTNSAMQVGAVGPTFWIGS